VSVEEKMDAIKRIKSLLGMQYGTKDLILTGLIPSLVKGDISPDEGAICSAVIAYAYPGIDFRPGYSQRVVRPGDLHRSMDVDEVAAFSSDQSLAKEGEIRQEDILTDIPQARTLEEFKAYLQPGDIIMTKPNSKHKALSIIDQWMGGTGIWGKLQKLLNINDRWAHTALWTGEDQVIGQSRGRRSNNA
jgi:hypothetical protein